MLSELKPVAIQLEAGTAQLSASIADLRPEHWLARIDGRTNDPAFIALHLLEARRYLLGLLGHETTHGFEELVEGAKDLEDIAEYPSRALRIVNDTARPSSTNSNSTIEARRGSTANGNP